MVSPLNENEKKQNPEEVKDVSNALTKGMREVSGKNIAVNMDSKTGTWEDLDVPQNILNGLLKLSFKKPSIIQFLSIKKVMGSPDENHLF
jgi:superfamily II DNA/RNA helicase